MSEAFVSEVTYENARRAVAVLDEDQRLGLALLLCSWGQYSHKLLKMYFSEHTMADVLREIERGEGDG